MNKVKEILFKWGESQYVGSFDDEGSYVSTEDTIASLKALVMGAVPEECNGCGYKYGDRPGKCDGWNDARTQMIKNLEELFG